MKNLKPIKVTDNHFHEDKPKLMSDSEPNPVKYRKDETESLYGDGFIRAEKRMSGATKFLLLSIAIAIICFLASGYTIHSQTDYFVGKTGSEKLNEKYLVDSSNATPISAGTTSEKILQEVGAPSSLKVIFTDNPNLNCGYQKVQGSTSEGTAYETDPDNWVSGCFQSAYEDYIFVYWGKNVSFETRKFFLLHEYGHYTQRHEQAAAYYKYNHGEENIVETDADCRAVQYGALATTEFNCSIPNWTPEWLSEQ